RGAGPPPPPGVVVPPAGGGPPDRAGEHLGEERATRYMRKFHPWYIERLGLDKQAARALGESLQTAATLPEVRELLAVEPAPA
ncbi:MAG: hypothetical protein ACTHM1_08390, partial [Solirubrobacteraceae bacterium]